MIDDSCVYAQQNKGTHILLILWVTDSFLIFKHAEMCSARVKLLFYMLDDKMI